MRRQLFSALVLSTFLPGCAATTAAAPHEAILPLRTLRLYETGVGYFERTGRVSAQGSLALPVPAAHIDDALKTVVLVGPGGQATALGIEFDSVVSKGMARALAGLPQDADAPLDYRGLLSAMKGAALEIRTKTGTFTGQLMDVYDAPPSVVPARPAQKGDAGAPVEASTAPTSAANVPWLLVLTTDGEVRRVEASEVEGVRPLDAAFRARIGAAADTLSVRAAQSQRTLRVLAHSDEPITLGYIAEVPVWRSSYRLVLDAGQERGMLQGWALLHNDTDEGWHSVKVELVSGRPDSFLFPLAAPRYSRRGLAEPSETLSTVPQLVDRTPDQIWGDHVDSGVGMTGYGEGGGGYGSGVGYGRASVRQGVSYVSPASLTGASTELAIGNLASLNSAEGVEVGALFRYALAQPIELRAHGSTLVPFLGQRVEARRLSFFSAPNQPARSALRLTNVTRQTLPAGTLAIYEAGAFAGEAGLDRLKPTERSFIEFGADLDVEIELSDAKVTDTPRSLHFADDRLTENFVRHHVRHYRLKNRSEAVRSVYLVLDIVANSKVTGADELDYDHVHARALAVFAARPRARADRELQLDEALATTTSIDALSSALLLTKADSPALDDGTRAILREAAARLKEAEAGVERRRALETEVDELTADLARLREDLAALGDKSGSPAAANPIVTRLLAGEDRLIELRKRQKELDADRAIRRSAVRSALAKLGTSAK